MGRKDINKLSIMRQLDETEEHCVFSWRLLQEFKELEGEMERYCDSNTVCGDNYYEIIHQVLESMSHLEEKLIVFYKMNEKLYNMSHCGAYYEEGEKHIAGILDGI